MSHADTVRAYLRAIEQDAPLTDFFTDDVVQEEFPNALSPTGATRTLTDIEAGRKRGRSVLSGQNYEVLSLVEDGTKVACEVIWRGALAISIGSLKAGDTMTARFAVFFEFRGARICSQRNYDCFDPF